MNGERGEVGFEYVIGIAILATIAISTLSITDLRVDELIDAVKGLFG